MSLAQILFPAPTDQGIDDWFHSHVRHHEAIIKAIQDSRGIQLQMFPIYPVKDSDLTNWNRAHQSLHTQMNLALQIAGTDLTTLDLKAKDHQNWFFEHFIQHQAAGQRCGEPI